MKEILIVLLISILGVLAIAQDSTPTNLSWINTRALGTYDVNPGQFLETGKHKHPFIMLSKWNHPEFTGYFCNFSVPSGCEYTERYHIRHDHSYTIDDKNITFYCYGRDYDNVVFLIEKTIGSFNEDFSQIIIKYPNNDPIIYLKTSKNHSFPGTPVPVGKIKK